LKKWHQVIALIGAVTVASVGCSVQSGVSSNSGIDQATQGHPSAPEHKNKHIQAHSPGSSISNKKQSTEQKNDKIQNKPKQGREEKDNRIRNNSMEGGKTDKPLLKKTIKVTADGRHIVTNPNSILVCANKHRSLGKYVPKDLAIPDIPFPYGKHAKLEKMHLRKVAVDPIENLFKAAKKDGIDLVGISGYRSYDYQVEVFARNVKQYGGDRKKANQVSAHPGQSEHQTGLTMDVSTQEIGFQLSQKLGDTKAGKWLADNAWKYGYIIRYLKGKENITGYEYEPWHIRYVGKKAAKIIAAKGITLEEYLSK
jgi:D-alanyl-D-alanine carboxypeptidase